MRRKFSFCVVLFCLYTLCLANVFALMWTEKGQEFMVEMYPNTIWDMQDIASRVISEKKDGSVITPLPDGYSFDNARSTERVFCLKYWDGTWAKYTWASAYPEVDSGHGLLYHMATFGFPLLSALLLTLIAMAFKSTRVLIQKAVDFIQ